MFRELLHICLFSLTVVITKPHNNDLSIDGNIQQKCGVFLAMYTCQISERNIHEYGTRVVPFHGL